MIGGKGSLARSLAVASMTSVFKLFNASNPSAAKGGFGFSNQGTIDGLSVLQPRASFNYTVDSERMLQFRGGTGRFISNTPAVWVANPYSGNGVARDGGGHDDKARAARQAAYINGALARKA